MLTRKPKRGDRIIYNNPSTDDKPKIYVVMEKFRNYDDIINIAVPESYAKDGGHELEKSGYKIQSTPGDPERSYHCPALSAEWLQTKTEHILIDSAAEMLGENGDFRNNLLCHGLKKYHEFIDLVVKLVVNAPGFKNPLTGE